MLSHLFYFKYISSLENYKIGEKNYVSQNGTLLYNIFIYIYCTYRFEYYILLFLMIYKVI